MALSASKRLLLPVAGAAAAILLTIAGLIYGASLQELDLNPSGTVYEVNRSAGGDLWISDFGAREVRQVNPATTVYTTYNGLNGATDARPDGSGNLWWLDFGNNQLGLLASGQSSALHWALGGTGTATGLAIDDQGDVWISHLNTPLAQRFVLSTTQLCDYNFPTRYAAYTSWYVQADQGQIWLAGWNLNQLGRVFRLDPDANIMSSWGPFPQGSNPTSISLVGDGSLWFADPGLRELTHLFPGQNRVNRYPIPNSARAPVRTVPATKLAPERRSAWELHAETEIPMAVAVQDERIWFTDPTTGRAGSLAPSVAISQSAGVSASSEPVDPQCQTLGAGVSDNIIIRGGYTAAWTAGSLSTVVDSGGWTLYEMPGQSMPVGLATAAGSNWISQQNRQKLAWLSYEPCYYLALSHSGGGGDPTASPAKSVGCGSGQYVPGEAITVTAAPDPGYGIGGWSGTAEDGSREIENNLVMPAADHQVQVDYAACFSLTLGHSGQGGDPAAGPVNSPGCAAGYFTAGTAITLTAAPAAGWTVIGWSGTADDGSLTAENSLVMPAGEHAASVTYGQCFALSLGHSGQGSDPTAVPANSAGCAAGQFVTGTAISLTAAPAADWTVTGWSGTDDDNSTAVNNSLVMPAGEHAAGVTYGQCFALSLGHSGQGGDPTAGPANSPGCSTGRFLAGQAISLTANPSAGWAVTGWSGTADDNSTSAQNSLVIPAANHAVSVTYGQCFALSLSHSGQGGDPTAIPANSPGCAAGTFTAETAISLTAAPAADWTVTGWSGTDDDGSTEAQNSLVMPAAGRAVSVTYGQCFALSLSHSGQGGDPTAIPANSPGCAAAAFTSGMAISLTAAPAAAWTVTGWSGTADNSSAALQNSLVMPAADHAASVTYGQCFALSLGHSGQGGNPAATPANSPGCASSSFLAGAAITLTAAPGSGWGVAAWSGVDDELAVSLQSGLTMPAADHDAAVAYGQCHALSLEHTGEGADPSAEPAASAGCSQGQIAAGATITVSASPANGWSVGGWQGTLEDNTSAVVNRVLMPASAHLVSVFYTQCHWLLLSHTGQGADPLADPAGSPDCDPGRFRAGQAISLTAGPDTGWAILGWSGSDDDGARTVSNNLIMPATSREVTVHYGQCHLLSLVHTGQGSDPLAEPANSPGCDPGRFVAGDVITLTAAPAAGWGLAAWSGSDDDGTAGLEKLLTMPNAGHQVAVSYGACRTLGLSHSGQGSDPLAVPSGSPGCSSGDFAAGASIGLTADPAAGWSVAGWSGTANDGSTATANNLVMPDAAHSVSVTYGQCFLLSLGHSGSGADPLADPAGSPGCPTGYYLAGAAISLTANPTPGWAVTGWSGTAGDDSTASTNSLVMPNAAHAVSVAYGQCFGLSLGHNGSGADPLADPGGSPGCPAGHYLAGTAITLTAEPAQGWSVAGWSGTDDDGSIASINSLTMPAGDHIATVAYRERTVVYLPIALK